MRLIWAKSREEQELCFAIRHQVFVLEQSVPIELELDAYDALAHHLLALSAEGQPAGTARAMLDTPSAGTTKIGRVAVPQVLRGRGIATAMMRFLENAAREAGQHRIDLDAQLAVMPLYHKLGYQAYGTVFEDAGIEHRKMELVLD